MSELHDHSSRAHALLSASSAHRWLNCPPSAIAADLYPATDTEYTREGTLAHEVAELIASAMNEHAFPLLPDGVDQEMIDCAKAYADYIQEQKQSDDAVVLLEQRVDFSPWVPRGFGTADAIIIQNKVMDVIDYKYGKGVAVSAIDNEQEMLYGLGALNEYGYVYDIDLIRLHIFQPRLNNVSVFEISFSDLMEWGEERVAPIAEQAIRGEGEYKAGDHCRFCPHAGRCRELTRVCSEHIITHGVEADVPVLAPWEVAEVLRKEPLITLWLKRVKDQALTAMLNGDEVPGYKVVAGRGNRSWRDEIEAAIVLQNAGYKLEEITETKLLSVAAMEKAIGRKKAVELLPDLYEKKTGAPTVAPVTDKRPAYDRLAEAQKDFN